MKKFSRLRAAAFTPEPKKGFTLLEVLLSMFILALVMTSLWSAYRGAFTLTADAEAQGKAYQSARAVMDILGRDIMAVTTFRGRFEFSAAPEIREGKDFTTLSFSAKNRGNVWEEGAPAGINLVRYLIREDGQGRHRLIRETAPLPSGTESRPQGFVLCEDLEAFKLHFYDAENKRHDKWETQPPPGGKPGPLPHLLEVELHLKEGVAESPRRFTTAFSLPVVEGKP